MVGDASGARPVDRAAVLTPPYAAYSAFEAFLRRAASEPIPALVDKPLLVVWEIAAQNESSLLTTLKSLGILNEAGQPTDLYHELRLSRPRRLAALRRCQQLAYPSLAGAPDAGLDANQLHDYFVGERGLTGQMVDKASRFYGRLRDAIIAEASEVPSHPVNRRPRPQPMPPAPLVEDTELDEEPKAAPSVRAGGGRDRKISRTVGRSRAPAPLTLVVQVQVTPMADEAELVALFRRIQSAWRHAAGSEGPKSRHVRRRSADEPR
jgi:hypothetical protein